MGTVVNERRFDAAQSATKLGVEGLELLVAVYEDRAPLSDGVALRARRLNRKGACPLCDVVGQERGVHHVDELVVAKQADVRVLGAEGLGPRFDDDVATSSW